MPEYLVAVVAVSSVVIYAHSVYSTYSRDNETGHPLALSLPQKRKNDEKEKQERIRKDEVEKKKVMKRNGNEAFSQKGPRKRQTKTSSFMLCL